MLNFSTQDFGFNLACPSCHWLSYPCYEYGYVPPIKIKIRFFNPIVFNINKLQNLLANVSKDFLVSSWKNPYISNMFISSLFANVFTPLHGPFILVWVDIFIIFFITWLQEFPNLLIYHTLSWYCLKFFEYFYTKLLFSRFWQSSNFYPFPLLSLLVARLSI